MRRLSKVLALGLLCLLIFPASLAFAQHARWLVTAAGELQPTGSSDEATEGLAIDSAGNIYVAVSSTHRIDLGGGLLPDIGEADIHLAKYDSEGNHIWSEVFGGPVGDIAFAIALDPDENLVVTGYVRRDVDLGGGVIPGSDWGDLFVAKYDADGNHLWSIRHGGDRVHIEGLGMVVDDAGRIFVTGRYYSYYNLGPELGGDLLPAVNYENAMYVVCYDAGGNHLWSRAFRSPTGSSRTAIGQAIALDPDGNLVLTGDCQPQIDLGGGPIGDANSGYETFLGKLDAASGAHIWSVAVPGGGEPAQGRALTCDASGNVFVVQEGAGSNAGPALRKYDGSGNLQWSKDAGPNCWGSAFGVATDAVGNVVYTGYYLGQADFGGGPLPYPSTSGRTLFVAKYANDGTYYWANRFGGLDRNYVARHGEIAVDPMGNTVVAGGFNGINLSPLGEYIYATAEFGRDMFVLSCDDGGVVPVLLQDVASRWDGQQVELTWRLFGSDRPLRFDIARAEGSSLTQPLAEVELTPQDGAFRWLDGEARPGSSYRYHVDALDGEAVVASFDANVDIPMAALSLGPNHPNPFNPRTTITFNVPRAQRVVLLVLDAAGRRVRTLLDEVRPSGSGTVEWNGRDDRGRAVASGSYIFRLQTEKGFVARKGLLMK